MKNEKEKKKQNKNKQTIEETMKCPKCGSTHLTKDCSRAELVCEKCRLVIDVEIVTRILQKNWILTLLCKKKYFIIGEKK